MGLEGLPPLREVIRTHGLTARKSLGQNFILDLNLTRRIARAAGDLSDKTVVEIGPGPGGLTRALLLEGAGKVVAIERDIRCLAALEDIAEAAAGRLEVHHLDALRVDYGALVSGAAVIVANLPYAVGTALLVQWLTVEDWPPWYESMTLMFQKEVAERVVAQPGCKSYGRLSILAQWRCAAQIVFTLPARAFTPPPKVDSALLQLVPRPVPSPDCSVASLARVTAAAFGQRRKMLRSSLKSLGVDPLALLEGAGIEPSRRAEELDIGGYGALAAALDEFKGESKGAAKA